MAKAATFDYFGNPSSCITRLTCAGLLLEFA